jgi:hypothetical protein
MNRIDIKTWLIIIMGLIIVFMGMFGKGGDTTELEKLLQEREAQNSILQERIDQRLDSIKMYKDSAEYYMQEDQLKAEIISALEELREKQKRDIDFLKKKLKNVPAQVDTASDQQRIEFWREYFRRKGIKP